MSRPEWSRALRVALELERRANELRDVALAVRCDERESGGQRCAADRYPEHKHRIEDTDLP